MGRRVVCGDDICDDSCDDCATARGEEAVDWAWAAGEWSPRAGGRGEREWRVGGGSGERCDSGDRGSGELGRGDIGTAARGTSDSGDRGKGDPDMGGRGIGDRGKSDGIRGNPDRGIGGRGSRVRGWRLGDAIRESRASVLWGCGGESG